MARVPPSGTLLVTPMGHIRGLKDAISSISKAVPLGDFTDEELMDILGSLGLAIGQGVQSTAPILRRKINSPKDADALPPQSLASSTLGSVDSEILQNTLQKASESCEFLLDLIDVKEGFQFMPPVKSEARGCIFKWLRINPEVSQGTELFAQVEAIMRGVGQLKEASNMAGFELSKTKFSSGRPKNTWFIDFTELLISICQSRNVEPTLSRNSKTEKPSGKLFIFAKAMEKLLPEELRSPSDEALLDRLKVANKAIAKKRENLS